MNTKMDVQKREELITLVKEFAVVEPWEDGDGATIKIDLTASGYYKPHNGLTEIVDELFPEYTSIASDLSPDGILSYCCESVEAVQKRKAIKEHFEKTVFPYIMENAKLQINSDNTVPFKEQEVICTVTIEEDIDHPHVIRFICNLLKQKFPEYAWGPSFPCKVDGALHITLLSEALWKKRLPEIFN